MKKRMFTLTAVAAFALALTACGTAQTGSTPTPTTEPTVETQTPETEPTAEPIATSTPVPTATSTVLAQIEAILDKPDCPCGKDTCVCECLKYDMECPGDFCDGASEGE